MRDHRPIGEAPNYTNPALFMMAVNLIWIFFAIWAVYGILPVLLLAAGLNHLIDRLHASLN
jgi:hypothetical protein